jgi:hypothetical protein
MRLAQRGGLARKHAICALHDRRLAVEPPHHLRQLDAGGSPTQHEQASRDDLHAGRLTRPPTAFELTEARDRRHDRIRAGRHDDVLRGAARAVDVDRTRAG